MEKLISPYLRTDICTVSKLSEKPERLDIRLSEEEKKRLAELAKERGVSMTDLVRTWIMRGDVVRVLGEQLHDFVKDFDKWHVSENRNTSIRYLCERLHGRTGAIKDQSNVTMLFNWTNFFGRSFQLLKRDLLILKGQLGELIKSDALKHTPIERTILTSSIIRFSNVIVSYHDTFINGFLEILKNMDEDTKRDTGGTYNDEVRTRYNEIASKYEDYIKRAERELGGGLERSIPRAKEFRPNE